LGGPLDSDDLALLDDESVIAFRSQVSEAGFLVAATDVQVLVDDAIEVPDNVVVGEFLQEVWAFLSLLLDYEVAVLFDENVKPVVVE
jgi:hypothetical protein